MDNLWYVHMIEYDKCSISNVWTKTICAHMDWYNHKKKKGYHSPKLLKKIKFKYMCVIDNCICKRLKT